MTALTISNAYFRTNALGEQPHAKATPVTASPVVNDSGVPGLARNDASYQNPETPSNAVECALLAWAKKHAPSMLVGAVAGSSIRLPAQFALAKLAVTLPTFAASVGLSSTASLILTAATIGITGAAVGAVAGGVAKIAQTYFFEKEKTQEKGWALQAFKKGLLWGAIGGAFGAGIREYGAVLSHAVGLDNALGEAKNYITLAYGDLREAGGKGITYALNHLLPAANAAEVPSGLTTHPYLASDGPIAVTPLPSPAVATSPIALNAPLTETPLPSKSPWELEEKGYRLSKQGRYQEALNAFKAGLANAKEGASPRLQKLLLRNAAYMETLLKHSHAIPHTVPHHVPAPTPTMVAEVPSGPMMGVDAAPLQETLVKARLWGKDPDIWRIWQNTPKDDCGNGASFFSKDKRICDPQKLANMFSQAMWGTSTPLEPDFEKQVRLWDWSKGSTKDLALARLFAIQQGSTFAESIKNINWVHMHNGEKGVDFATFFNIARRLTYDRAQLAAASVINESAAAFNCVKGTICSPEQEQSILDTFNRGTMWIKANATQIFKNYKPLQLT